MDIILPFFDHLPTSRWTFFTLNVDQNWHFLTIYPPHVVHVFFERPLLKTRFQTPFVRTISMNKVCFTEIIGSRWFYRLPAIYKIRVHHSVFWSFHSFCTCQNCICSPKLHFNYKFILFYQHFFSDRNHSFPSSPWKLGACLERTSAYSWCHLHSNSNYGFHSFGTFSIRRWSQSNVIIFSIFLGN